MSATIAELGRHGPKVRGEVGDADALAAIGDALHGFWASEIMISTWPSGASNWLERNLMERVIDRFGLPTKHLVSAYDSPVPTRAA